MQIGKVQSGRSVVLEYDRGGCQDGAARAEVPGVGRGSEVGPGRHLWYFVGRGVRPSLVPMRDLVHTIDGARVDSGTGRTGTRREDSAWDLGNGQ